MNKKMNVPLFVPSGIFPTEEQRAIQLSQHRITLIHANAGAAKTTTLALRIGEALARKLAPEKILALVFTSEAKDVMRSRLTEIGVPYVLSQKINIHTIEEFAKNTLAKIERYETPFLQSYTQLKPHVLAALEQVSQRYLGKVEFLDIQTHNIAINQFLECQVAVKAKLGQRESFDDIGLEEISSRLGISVVDYLTLIEYERNRRDGSGDMLFRGPFDATYDLASHVCDYPDLENGLPSYRLIVGDELHDLNEASFQIIKNLLMRDHVYFVGAGDADQVIYSTYGAHKKYLQREFHIFGSAANFPLTMTFRHGPHLAYAVAAFKQKEVESNLACITEIVQSHYDEKKQEICADKVVDALQAWIKEKFPLDRCTILLRDRYQSIAIENALMNANIGYATEKMPRYLRREEILFLRGMIAVLLEDLHTVTSMEVRRLIVEALAIFGELNFEPNEMEYARSVISQDPSILQHFFTGQLSGKAANLKISKIASVISTVKALPSTTAAATVLREIVRLMDLGSVTRRIYVHSHEASIVSKSIEGFIAMAEKLALNLDEFSKWIGRAEEFSNAKKKNLVLLECIENSKGKEFDHVIMPFLEFGQFPAAGKINAEEENLFYVGITRARLRLTLVSPISENLRSSFLKRLDLLKISARANNAVTKNKKMQIGVPTRTDLTVPFEEKDLARSLGAKWDSTRKIWYVLPGSDLEKFSKWLF